MKNNYVIPVLALGIALAPAASAELLWQDFSLTYVGAEDYELMANESGQVITVDHASGHSWGDTYFFMDHYDFVGKTSKYFEFAPRLSLGKLSGRDLSFGPVKDVLISTNWESGNGFDNYMYGVGLSLDIPGFNYLDINFYAVENDSVEDDEMLTLVWGYPFTIGTADFLYDGFVDWSTEQGDHASEMNFTSQLKWNLGKHLGFKAPLYVGMEYAHWTNKFGVDGVDERNPGLLVRWHF
ncbi:MAG: ion channel protein Tsx [Oceanospirillaceae bacterium]|nr:ion channel protein Tsx [Oceanospirillaceae bacterium]